MGARAVPRGVDEDVGIAESAVGERGVDLVGVRGHLRVVALIVAAAGAELTPERGRIRQAAVRTPCHAAVTRRGRELIRVGAAHGVVAPVEPARMDAAAPVHRHLRLRLVVAGIVVVEPHRRAPGAAVVGIRKEHVADVARPVAGVGGHERGESAPVPAAAVWGFDLEVEGAVVGETGSESVSAAEVGR